MASDSMPEQPATVQGDSVALSLVGHDLDDLTRVFTALSDGGEVSVPFEKQFWGDTFGMLTDRYGTQWMVNVADHA